MEDETREPETTEPEPDQVTVPQPIDRPILNRAFGLIVLAASLVLYYITTCPVVYFGDMGELTVAAYRFGIAHPPGYPSFIIPLSIFLRLPLGWLAPSTGFVQQVAWQANFFSGVMGALTIYVVYLIILRLSRLPFIALTGALLIATGRTLWSQTGIAEVYTLNAFLTALMVLFAIIQNQEPVGSMGRVRFLRWGCFIWGLMLSNHHESAFFVFLWFTMIFLALQPGPENRRPPLPHARTILEGIFFTALGLLPYLYLPIASAFKPVLNWGDPSSFGNFIDVLTRSEYRSIKAAITGDLVTSLDILFSYLYWSVQQYSPAMLILAIPGLGILFRKSDHRVAVIGTAISIFLMSATFIVYFAGIDRPSMFFLEVYFIPWYIALGVLIAMGIPVFVSFFKTVSPGRNFFFLSIGIALLLTAANSGYFRNFKYCDMRDNIAGYVYSHDVLATLPDSPQRHVLITGGDEIFLFWYWKWAEDLDKEVAVIGTDALGACTTWFWDDIGRDQPDLDLPNDEENCGRYVGDDLRLAMLESILRDNRSTYRVWMTSWDPALDPILREGPWHMVLDGPVLELEWDTETNLADYPRASTPADPYLFRMLLDIERAGLAPFEEEIYERYASACYNIATYFQWNSQPELAIEYASLCMQFSPGYTLGPHRQSPMTIIEQSIPDLVDLEIAETEILTLLEYDPRNSRLHAAVGELYYLRGMVDDAVYALELAITIDLDDFSQRNALAEQLQDAGDRDGSERELQAIVRLQRQMSLYHSRLAEIYYNEGDTGSALNELRAALDLDPENELIQGYYDSLVEVEATNNDQ